VELAAHKCRWARLLIRQYALVGVLFLVVGLAAAVAAVMAANGSLPRNRIVGMRTRATLASDAAWRAAHRASAWSVAAAGAISTALGLYLLVAQPSRSTKAAVAIAASAALLVLVVIGGVQADRVARRTSN
jgi:hypothetical protein